MTKLGKVTYFHCSFYVNSFCRNAHNISSRWMNSIQNLSSLFHILFPFNNILTRPQRFEFQTLFAKKNPPTFRNSSIFTFPMKSTHFHFSLIGIHPHDAKSWDEETYSELKDAARWKQYFWQNKRRFSPRTMSAPGSLLLILSGAPYMYNHIWPSQLCEDIGDDLNTHHLCETSGAPNVLLSGSVASTSTGIFRLRKSRLRSLRNRWFWSGWWWLEISSK